MSMAYAMINAEIGCEAEVMEELKSISGVQEVYKVYGVYDIIIKIEAETMQDLKEIVLLRVRNLKNIRSMLPLICV